MPLQWRHKGHNSVIEGMRTENEHALRVIWICQNHIFCPFQEIRNMSSWFRTEVCISFLQNWALSLPAWTTFWTKIMRISSETFVFSKLSNILLLKRGTPQKVRAKCHHALVIGSVSKCIIFEGIRWKIKQGVSIQKVCTNISKFDLWKYFPKFLYMLR